MLSKKELLRDIKNNPSKYIGQMNYNIDYGKGTSYNEIARLSNIIKLLIKNIRDNGN